MLPNEGVGARMPTPRYERVASPMIAAATPKVAIMIAGAITCGTRESIRVRTVDEVHRHLWVHMRDDRQRETSRLTHTRGCAAIMAPGRCSVERARAAGTSAWRDGLARARRDEKETRNPLTAGRAGRTLKWHVARSPLVACSGGSQQAVPSPVADERSTRLLVRP